jgi:hypothetical protein
MGGQACVLYGAAQFSKVCAEQSRDREYWEPLKKELEQMRFEEKPRRDN